MGSEGCNMLAYYYTKVLPGINIKREIDDLLEIGHDSTDVHPSSTSYDATTSQTSVTRTRDSMTLLTEHSLGHINSPGPFASQLLQAIRLTDVVFAPSSSYENYEDDAWWKQSPVGPDCELHYYGPSSMETLVRDAETYLDQVIDESACFRSKFSCPPRAESRAYDDDELISITLQAEMPPDDLVPILIDRYFERVNSVLPILHRPLFESQFRSGLHAREEDFTRLLLVVCAIGARGCEDPRVLDEQWPSKLSAGVRWFRGAYRGGINAIYRPSLINAQLTVVSTIA
ncbi:hypothetical protein RSOLAG1IB_08258 [Rhizoctonia solani AG-1 IB]|uniref:Xylanolytic transcriptional activator regulatory domain-containing protein n=1 Tax=Thanatephorus cucumeris (strain AG1-IB / isolate 7/3/14) TaxID=1108050 RepID=A0A0B7FH96_THACB|nr:hypothetical protein RSOLAG1IB_08258 [Rhizoctonia solani AG-1 IB]